jgi:hypothetical protein
LQAACYGKAFCPDFPKDSIYSVAQKLRVLNCLWAPEHGLPVSMAQLEALSLPVLVARLTASRRHLLALRISRVMGLPEEPVLTHWACARISTSTQVMHYRCSGPCPFLGYVVILGFHQTVFLTTFMIF